jgi:hypothetical protein
VFPAIKSWFDASVAVAVMTAGAEKNALSGPADTRIAAKSAGRRNFIIRWK